MNTRRSWVMSWALSRLRHLLKCRRGNFAMMAALLSPLLLGLGGGVVDLAIYQMHRSDLQTTADAAALAAAREASLKGWNSDTAKQVATTLIEANLSERFADSVHDSSIVVDDTKRRVDVEITQDHFSYFVLGYFKHSPQIRVRSTAKASGQALICLIVMTPVESAAFQLKGSARIDASDCSTYSNSSDSKGILANNTALLISKLTCSAGGYSGKPSNFSPSPITDCPTVSDPLESRAELIDNAIHADVCDFSNQQITGVKKTLYPGTYCKGLKITAGSDIVLAPGIYVFRDGRLRLERGSRLTGAGVGLVFVGDKSVIQLKNDSTISLTAPTDGPMAGILLYGQMASKTREFAFESQNAEKMVGTVYLPNDKLTVGGDKNGDGTCDLDLEDIGSSLTPGCHADIGTTSSWTAIVAKLVEVTAGANLVLNANYAGSITPVPLGIGPTSEGAILAK